MRVLFIAVFLLTQNVIFAQDLIFKKSGEKISAKVLEVTSEDVKYKKFDYQDGPSYTVKKSNLLSITYANGDEDLFKVDQKKGKRMFVWPPSLKKAEFPKVQVSTPIDICIVDLRVTPPKKSIVEASGSDLIGVILTVLLESGARLNSFDSKAEVVGSGNGVYISIEAYDATFYPGAWHAQTRYFVEVYRGGQKYQREIESLKGAFNTLGQSTAKARLSRSFEEATSQLIDFINSPL